jgi:hypothetical protein
MAALAVRDPHHPRGETPPAGRIGLCFHPAGGPEMKEHVEIGRLCHARQSLGRQRALDLSFDGLLGQLVIERRIPAVQLAVADGERLELTYFLPYISVIFPVTLSSPVSMNSFSTMRVIRSADSVVVDAPRLT